MLLILTLDLFVRKKDIDAGDEQGNETAVQKLSREFGGVIVVQKGSVDLISNGQKSKHTWLN